METKSLLLQVKLRRTGEGKRGGKDCDCFKNDILLAAATRDSNSRGPTALKLRAEKKLIPIVLRAMLGNGSSISAALGSAHRVSTRSAIPSGNTVHFQNHGDPHRNP